MDQRQTFRDLHQHPFIIPNPWDAGSAKILASLGFSALATTSAGFANMLGRMDGEVTREEAIAHAAAIDGATSLPVNADLENGFGEAPSAAAETISQALSAGIAGGSIEDFGGGTLYEASLATDRIRAAVGVNRESDSPLVLTARAENYIRGNPDLEDTIKRLQAYQEAGADVLYAPGLTDLGDIKTLVSSVDRPVNVLVMPGGPTIPDLFEVGVIRVSTGSSISMAAQAAIVEAGRELLDEGTHGFWMKALPSAAAVNAALAEKR